MAAIGEPRVDPPTEFDCGEDYCKVTRERNGYPWRVDGPHSAVTLGGERLHFDEPLGEGMRVGHGDADENVFGPFGVVVRREDGLWIEAEIGPGDIPSAKVLLGLSPYARAVER